MPQGQSHFGTLLKLFYCRRWKNADRESFLLRLQKLPTTKWGKLAVRFLSAKTCNAFKFLFVLSRSLSGMAQAACCLQDSSGPAVVPAPDVTIWVLGSQWFCGHVVLACVHCSALVKMLLQNFSQSHAQSLVMIQLWQRHTACVLQRNRLDLVTQMGS